MAGRCAFIREYTGKEVDPEGVTGSQFYELIIEAEYCRKLRQEDIAVGVNRGFGSG